MSAIVEPQLLFLAFADCQKFSPAPMKIFQAAAVLAASFLAYNVWEGGMTLYNDAELHTSDVNMCFREASMAFLRSEVTEKEYYTLLLTHLRGVRHPGDDLANTSARRSARNGDMFASSLREVALGDNYKPIKGKLSSQLLCCLNLLINQEIDIEPYVDLLESCSNGNLIRLQQIYNSLRNYRNHPNLVQPLAVLAARSGQPDVLRFCLARGATFDADLDRAVFSGLQTTTTLEILWSYNWHGLRDSPTTLNQLACGNIYHPALLSWLIDHGAEIDLRTYQRAALGPVSVPVMKTLVEMFGSEALKSTGSLQMAAARGDAGLVEYLLEIGLDPNEIPPPIDEREPISTALYEAVKADFLDIVRILIKYGADLDHPRSTRSAILAMAHSHKSEDLIELIHPSP